MNIKDWLDRATSKIEFEPDRAAVRRELADHLQDRQERYAARGLPTKEAEAAALADMGEPAEIAEELGKLHRPFWGYLWRLSQGLLALIAVLLAIALCYVWEDRTRNHSYAGPPEAVTSPETAFGSDTIPEYQQLSGKVRRGWYTFTAYALIRQTKGPENFLHIYLRARPALLWEPAAAYGTVVRRATLTDSTGGCYSLRSETESSSFESVSGGNSGPNAWFMFTVPIEEARLPDWVEVTLNMDQPAIRLDLREGALQG